MTVIPQPLSMREAVAVARMVRAAELGGEATATVRPRGVVGLARSRAPLPIVLYVADREGRLLRPDGKGVILLEPPSMPPWRVSHGMRMRLLGFVDRRWDFLCMFGPPALALLMACLFLPFRPLWGAALLLAVAAIGYVFVFQCGQLLWPVVDRVRRLGTGPQRMDQLAAQSLPAYHWSIRLCHLPDPARAQTHLQAVTGRVVRLIEARLSGDADRIGARVSRVEVVETIICLTRGITTRGARDAMGAAAGTVRPYQSGDDVLVVLSSGRLEKVARQPAVGGDFVFLYLFGLAVATVVLATFVADMERAACLPGDCAGRPATFVSAVSWLAHRLLVFDMGGLTPATLEASVLGWLMSVAGITTIPVVFVAARQQIARNRQHRQEYENAMAGVTARSRVLILVVSPVERDAVFRSVGAVTGQVPVPSFADDRTIYALGRVSGADILLAQAGEQGGGTPAGMAFTAKAALAQARPDYVILTGICYGLRPTEQAIGDVVFSRRVHDLDHALVYEHEGDRRVGALGVNVQPAQVLIDRCNAAEVTWPKDRAAVRSGLVLSSASLVESRAYVAELRARYPHAVAGEMESAAVYAAAVEAGVAWIMVKGISDWGEGRTGPEREVAARNAAEFVTHMVAIGGLDRRR